MKKKILVRKKKTLKKKPSVQIVLILVIVLLLIIIGSLALYFFIHVSKNSSQVAIETSAKENQLVTPYYVPTYAPAQGKLSVENGVAYTTQEGMQFFYPKDWFLSNPSGQVLFSNLPIKEYKGNFQGVVGYFESDWPKETQDLFGLDGFFNSPVGFSSPVSNGATGTKVADILVEGLRGVKIAITDSVQNRYSVLYAIKNGSRVYDFDFESENQSSLTQNNVLLDAIVYSFTISH